MQNTERYSTYKTAHLGSYLDEHLAPDQHNLVEVMQQTPAQNYLKRAEGISDILGLYHRVSLHSRDLLRQIDTRLVE